MNVLRSDLNKHLYCSAGSRPRRTPVIHGGGIVPTTWSTVNASTSNSCQRAWSCLDQWTSRQCPCGSPTSGRRRPLLSPPPVSRRAGPDRSMGDHQPRQSVSRSETLRHGAREMTDKSSGGSPAGRSVVPPPSWTLYRLESCCSITIHLQSGPLPTAHATPAEGLGFGRGHLTVHGPSLATRTCTRWSANSLGSSSRWLKRYSISLR